MAKQHQPDLQLVTMQRNCAALLIPEATPIIIPALTMVRIMQMLGGSITVVVNGNLARIEGKDADALGLSSTINSNKINALLQQEDKLTDLDVNMEQIWQQLRDCYDPEIPVNIVDLGLIYHCELVSKDKTNIIKVQMTLTAPSCGMGPILIEDIKNKVLQVPNVTAVEVEVVFEPVWTQDRLSDVAKLTLGLL